ncbi:MAG: hypothetical protein ABJD11_17370 [Gemmatimonadota bacterium]
MTSPRPLDDYLRQPTVWEESRDAERPFLSIVGSEFWVIKLNDYPREPLFSLIVNGTTIGDFDDWPEVWQR